MLTARDQDNLASRGFRGQPVHYIQQGKMMQSKEDREPGLCVVGWLRFRQHLLHVKWATMASDILWR
jgi:hypothetical protein